MQDGTYSVRLVLRDRTGHTYRESKTFVIASKPPVVQIKLDTKRFRRGQTMNLKAAASQSTRTLVASLEGAVPVALNWDAQRRHQHRTAADPRRRCSRKLQADGHRGRHCPQHGTQEVQIEILP